jgi:hypothetical protein
MPYRSIRHDIAVKQQERWRGADFWRRRRRGCLWSIVRQPMPVSASISTMRIGVVHRDVRKI